MKPIASAPIVKSALLAGVAAGSLLCGALHANAEIGVAAAVNVDARGRPPGGAPRVITLGTNVVFNEEISTDSAGLVQILLLDGTTFTVGPNSQLTIDEFVYDPGSGDAKVVATLTKGVFRFVGARTSQKDGGATVKTPVGTIGIRGGVANFSCDGGECKASLVAGKSLTIVDGDGTQRIVYETGYTAVISKDAGGTTTTIRKSTKEETGLIQQQLAGKQGQSGGTNNPPTDETVANSQVGQTNSQLPDTMIVPGSTKPVQSSEPDQAEEVAGIDGKTQDDVDNDIADQEAGDARLLMAPPSYSGAPAAGSRGLVGTTEETDQTLFLTRSGGRLVSANGEFNLPDFTGSAGDGALQAFNVTNGTSPNGNVSGPAYAGAENFVAYMLGIDGDPAQPFYVIYGTPTDANALLSLDTGNSIRRYTLTQDPIRQSPAPFFADDLYGAVSPGVSSDLYIIEPGDSADGAVRVFQSWVSIEGTGAAQRSAAHILTGQAFLEEESDEYVIRASRRGTYRHEASSGLVNMRGGVGTVAGANGANFFGQNADNFVIGAPVGDSYADPYLTDDFTGNPEDGYLGDGYPFGTHHVADLVEEEDASTFDRTSRSHDGFMSGMAEPNDGEGAYVLIDFRGDQPRATNFSMTLDATENSMVADGDAWDVYGGNSVVAGFALGYGGEGVDSFVDDDIFGAHAFGLSDPENQDRTIMYPDQGGAIPDTEDFGPGGYIVSGRADPVPGYELCSACDFIDWGWWGTRIVSNQGEPEEREDYVHMGTWVAGDVSQGIDPLGTLPFGGEATYTGDAIGTIARDDQKYIAAGTFEMNYDFAQRNGDFTLNIDGLSLSSGAGNIMASAPYSPGSQELFDGSIMDNAYVSGNIQGAFVNGPNVAAGVIGNFDFGGYDSGANQNVMGVGSFAGAGVPTPPITD